MIPTFAFPGESAPGQLGPMRRNATALDERVDPQQLVGGNALGDADDGPDTSVDRFVHGVRCERSRDEDHRLVRASLARRPQPCRTPVSLRRPATFAGGHTCNDVVRASGSGARENALRARQALDGSRVSVSTRIAIRPPARPRDGAVEHRRLRVEVGSEASLRMRRLLLLFVPSSRTTIGCFSSPSARPLGESRGRLPSHRVMPPKMLKKIDRTSRVDDLERVDDALRVPAPEIAEVGRPPARERHDVDRRHREARAVPEDADSPSSFTYVRPSRASASSRSAWQRRAARRCPRAGTVRCRRP